MANTLFKPKERLLVEERFLDTEAYELLAGACERLMNERSSLAEGGGGDATPSKACLHPAELFYQCFFILDTLKCKSPSLRMAYCDERAWDELLYYLREGGFTLALADLHLFIGCIMQGAAELLLRAGREHLSEVAALKRQIQIHAPLSVKTLDQAYRSSLRSMDEEELARTMEEYMAAEDRMYSEDIDTLLDEQQEVAASEVPAMPAESSSAEDSKGAAVAVSSVRIAPRMKTSVLVVLNAMFKAGWFVDANGSELKNRDTALNDILRHAFGIDKNTAISQTVYPSNNPNVLKKNNLILRQLLDEDEMEKFIKELQEELLDAYEDKE